MKKIYTQFFCLFLIFNFSDLQAQNTCNIQPTFTTQVATNNSLEYHFANTTSNYLATDSIFWEFGDGTSAVNVSNPTHVYANPGTYNVCLTIRRYVSGSTTNCNEMTCQTITVVNNNTSCNIQASFTKTHVASNPNLVYFQNTSSNTLPTDSVIWRFGDGTFAYNVNATSHTYATAGNYQVCLVIKRYTNSSTTPCVRETCDTVNIVSPTVTCNFQPNFTQQVATNNSLEYHFTNTTINYLPTDSLIWNFGDGSANTFIVANPTHIYANAGTYNVCLTVKRNITGATTPCSYTVCKTVTVVNNNTACNIQASFTKTHAANNPSLVYFQNTSTNTLPTDSIIWRFGDGTFAYNVNTTSHTYATSGNYQVCLVIKRYINSSTTPCVRETCDTVNIVSSTVTCNFQPNFTQQVATNNSLEYHFTNTTINYLPTDSLIWNFGDGSANAINVANPTHVYANAGTYNVCLTVKRNITGATTPCSYTVCKTVTVVNNNTACNIQASFTKTHAANNPSLVYFQNTSTNTLPTDSIIWRFGDGTFAYNVNTTSHTYATAGNYQVCLVIKRMNNTGSTPCIREICDTVSVTIPTSTNCNIQPNFNYQPTTNNSHLIEFINTTPNTQPNDSIWYVFDNGTTAIGPNATHLFSDTGYHNVCMYIKRFIAGTTQYCLVHTCKNIYVALQPTASACNYNVNFSSTIVTATGNTVQFTNLTTYVQGAIATWNFGDSTVSHDWNATHTFQTGGSHNVCLTVQYPNGCTISHCNVIQLPNAGNCVLQPYPNPTNNIVNISTFLQQNTLMIGKIISPISGVVIQVTQQGYVGSNTMSFNVSNLASGNYYITLQCGNQTCAGTFIKN